MKASTIKCHILIGALFFCFYAKATSNVVLDTFYYAQLYKKASQQLSTDFDKSINLALQSLDAAQQLEDESRQLKSITFIINSYLNEKSNYRLALVYLSEAQRLDFNKLNTLEQAQVYHLKSSVQLGIGNYEDAVKASYQQLELLRSTNDPLEKGRAIYMVGLINFFQDNFDDAIKHFKSALLFYQDANESRGIVSAHDAISCTLFEMEQYKESVYHDSLAMSIIDTLDMPSLRANVLINYGQALRKCNKISAAFEAVNEALHLSTVLGNQLHTSSAYNQLGKLHEIQKNINKAEIFYNEAIEIATEFNHYTQLRDNYKSLYKFYLNQRKNNKALAALQNHTRIKDSLNLAKNDQQLQLLKVQYDIDRNQHKYLALIAKDKEQELTIKKHQLQNLGLIIITLLSIFLAILLYRSYKSKNEYNKRLEAEVKARTNDLNLTNQELKSTNTKLKQSNLELERFAYIASHDLKSPLRNIVSFLGLSKRKLKIDKNADIGDYLKFASDNAMQMYALIQDVLEYSRVNNQSMTGWEKEVNLNEILANVVYNINSDIRDRNAEVITCDLPIIKGSKVHITQLFQNLIINGIKYNTSQQPRIQLSHEENMDEHVIQVKDNGIGIEEKYHQNVFEMFKRLHTQKNYSGTGLGLSICKKVIQDMKGKIWLESIPGEGTTFFVAIPKMPIQVMADQN